MLVPENAPPFLLYFKRFDAVALAGSDFILSYLAVVSLNPAFICDTKSVLLEAPII